MKLTEATVSKIAVPEGKRDVLVFDDALPGFGVRKFASGKASFLCKYQIGAKQRKITLGPAAPGTLGEMRKLASGILAKARLGQDTAAEKEALRGRKTASVGDLVPRFLADRREDLRPKTYSEWARYLQRYWQPLHGAKATEVTRKQIVAVLDDLVEAHGRVAADRARTALSAFYAWAIDRSHVDLSPVQNIKRRAKNGSRERVLIEDELLTVLGALAQDDYSAIVALLIFTGQRRDEIASLAWSEIDLAKRQFELPGARTKNKRAHVVPLSEPALAVLSGMNRRYGRALVFGSGSGGFSGFSKAKKQLDARLPAGMPAWTLHDIRRSVATHLGERGFATPHVVEAILNHVSGAKSGVAGTYNKALYLAERKEALDAWGAHLTSVLGNLASQAGKPAE
jgi:integrase